MRVFHSGHGIFPERMAAYREALEALSPSYRRTESAATADLIFYTEPGWNKFRAWTKTLSVDPVISTYPEKCFVYEFSDRPVAFLAGLYVNRPRSKIDWRRMRPADYWTSIPASDEQELLQRRKRAEPTLLVPRQNECRGATAASRPRPSRELPAQITETFRWHDYGGMEADKDRRLFLQEMRDSWFVLCPSGLAPSTFRVYEAMQLGRVPVILSDHWEPTPASHGRTSPSELRKAG